MGRILAIDYGKKRCGLAVTDPLRIIATALGTVETGKLWDFLKTYFQKEEVECIVVGEPRQMDYRPSECESYIRPFLQRFAKAYPGMRVERVDERFTSKIAQRSLLEMGAGKKKRQDKALVDSISATLILQTYLQMASRNNGFQGEDPGLELENETS